MNLLFSLTYISLIFYRSESTEIQEQVLEIIRNLAAHNGVKILLIDAGILAPLTHIYDNGKGNLMSKAESALASLGIEDQGNVIPGADGILHASIKEVCMIASFFF